MSAPVSTATTPGIAFGRRRVDRADVGVGVRAAQDGEVGHPGQLDVVEVAALAGDEARVLDPLDGGAEDVGRRWPSDASVMVARRLWRRTRRRRRRRASSTAASRIAADDVVVAGAAADVALDRVADLGRPSGRRFRASRSAAAMIMPGVQNPHWRPCFAQNASWSGWSVPSAAAMPSIVVTLEPSAWTASIVQLFTACRRDGRCTRRTGSCRSRRGCRSGRGPRAGTGRAAVAARPPPPAGCPFTVSVDLGHQPSLLPSGSTPSASGWSRAASAGPGHEAGWPARR